MTKKSVFNRVFSIFFWGTLVALAVYIFCIVLTVFLTVHSDSYSKILLSERVVSTIQLSLLCATIATLLAHFFAIPIAYLLARKDFKGKRLIDTIFDIPTVLSPVALGTALLVFLASDFGKFIEEHIITFTFTIAGIILAQFSVVVALAIRLLKTTFEDINPRYEGVAHFLGCNRWQTFYKVTLPISKNGIIASFIMTWARALGEFGATITIAGAVFGKTETIPSAIYMGLASVNIQETLIYILLLIFVAITILLVVRFVFTERRTVRND